MTYAPPEGPQPELSTTRVASGASARLVAVGVAGLLIGVVGFALANRPAPPVASSPTSAPVAVVHTPAPAPTPTPPRTQLEGNDGIFGWPVVAQLPLGRPGQPPIDGQPRVYTYAVSMDITGGQLRAVLAQQQTQVFAGSIVIDTADVGETLVAEPGQQWGEDGLTIFQSFGTWQVPLGALNKSHAGQVELLVVHAPPSADPGVPGPIASGFTFTVVGRRNGTHLTLSMELAWPPAAQSRLFIGTRSPGLFNRCRWDLGPLAARPYSNHDEAGC
jgi:hypothetical protein